MSTDYLSEEQFRAKYGRSSAEQFRLNRVAIQERLAIQKRSAARDGIQAVFLGLLGMATSLAGLYGLVHLIHFFWVH